MKRPLVTSTVPKKKSKLRTVDVKDGFVDETTQKLFESLEYAVPSCSKVSNDVLKKFNKFDDDFDSVQAKLEKIEKENEAVTGLIDQVMKAEQTATSFEKNKAEYCNYCNLQFVNQKAFCLHLFDRHVNFNKKFVRCGVCKKKCVNIESFDIHLESHLQHNCPACSVVTVSIGFKRHFMESHSYLDIALMDLGCDFCSFRSQSATSIQLHCLLCSNNPKNQNYEPCEEGRVCRECGQVFNTNLQMLRHKDNKHRIGVKENDSLKNFMCEDCGQSFFSIRSLGGHRRKHTKKLGVLADMMIPSSVNIGVKFSKASQSRDLVNNHLESRSHSVFEDMPDI